jgi:hypothetical protein
MAVEEESSVVPEEVRTARAREVTAEIVSGPAENPSARLEAAETTATGPPEPT